MRRRIIQGLVLTSMALSACEPGVRSIDLESRQFEATLNVDSTAGIDSSLRSRLAQLKSVYSFRPQGEGSEQRQQGMLTQDLPFTWSLAGDSLRINQQSYHIKKRDNGFQLRSDSTLLLLRQQP